MGQGWNRRVAPEAVRCGCLERRLAWAQLDWAGAGTACCNRPCCAPGPTPVAIMATREEIRLLRHRAVTEAWRCPRCGEYVARHDRNYECIDALTGRIRAIKQARGYPPPRGEQRR
jgi:hypothetical protein